FRAVRVERATLNDSVGVDGVGQRGVDARDGLSRGRALTVEPGLIRITVGGIVFARVEPIEFGGDAVRHLRRDAERCAFVVAKIEDIREVTQLGVYDQLA